ncbi:MAG TPA: 4-hydroxythreonine-4-phosphate dehydrogenase PdxA [Chitinophagaceae bacterium]|jgi:4-hydroxythreonine-4-phosphate dehydrogenase|nr:4-hydroxythreonine-4-phosphate dehydrogenase PdxA [Chitinophagaceae bacterium]
MTPTSKPIIGITCGDLNGIGTELIIKVFSDSRILELCTPVIFASNKVINFYRKTLPEFNFNWQNIRDLSRLNAKQMNIYNCWEEDVIITPGQLNETGGKYAVKSLMAAAHSLKQNEIDGLVTAPIHKKNVQSPEFNYTGHTPFLKNYFGVNDVVMILFANQFRVALVTEHIPVNEVTANISKETIVRKLNILNDSLKKDFGIEKPKIAVLGLNPHAGDEGLIGKEEEAIIKPAIKEAKQNNLVVTGPFSADSFFARQYHNRFDAVLAMYHDQGLVPFKTLASGEGVNYTAGLPAVRTSPDHGTAFDIAGKGKADESSFHAAIFECIDIINNRKQFEDNHKNPLKKMTSVILANQEDERIEEN